MVSHDFTTQIHTTFLDDSYKGTGPRDLVVTAQVPFDMDIRWFYELKKKLKRSREIKYKDVSKKWGQLGIQMESAIKNGIGQAIIVVCDPMPYIDPVDRIFNKSLAWLPNGLIKEISDKIINMNQSRILAQSPISRIIYNISGQAPDNHKLKRRLKNEHNMKLFVCRSICTFNEIYDKENWRKTFDELYFTVRYVSPHHIYAHILFDSQKIDRMFDEGNTLSTDLIRKSRLQISEELDDYFIGGSGIIGKVEEVNSEQKDHIQISDIAAGFARSLFQEADGKKKLKDHFKAVIYNGKLL